MTDRQTDR